MKLKEVDSERQFSRVHVSFLTQYIVNRFREARRERKHCKFEKRRGTRLKAEDVAWRGMAELNFKNTVRFLSSLKVGFSDVKTHPRDSFVLVGHYFGHCLEFSEQPHA